MGTIYFLILFFLFMIAGNCKGIVDNINYHMHYDKRDSQGNIIQPTKFEFWSYYSFKFPAGHTALGMVWDARHVFDIIRTLCWLISIDVIVFYFSGISLYLISPILLYIGYYLSFILTWK